MPQLSLDLTEGVATVTITNPPLATMDPGTVAEIAALLPRLAEADVRAVIFTGGIEGFFIRHYSVVELDRSAQGEAASRPLVPVNLHDLLLEIENLPKPVLTALNGTAMGGGWEFAMATDIRVAKDGPFRFGLPEVSVGILPGAGGTHSRETALDRARSIAREIAARPPLAVAHIKRLARAAVSPVSRDLLSLESRLFAELMQTPEARALLAQVATAHRKGEAD